MVMHGEMLVGMVIQKQSKTHAHLNLRHIICFFINVIVNRLQNATCRSRSSSSGVDDFRLSEVGGCSFQLPMKPLLALENLGVTLWLFVT